ncbi:AraC family transcriptional regulator [Shewanella schlegeliana]|uniref:Helix-turn-helix transcriptional regulator n=1 Tax=Shewanella schlegeliana TaxID=190308 RepID=A0ABS1T027_9GAMM|nr:AraC family transcriptional regulator [Shewanella schlegeliana]MBL4914115.1 helix-turn-helix transcriptional regulator [Shewanella schlegeliana]MCL1110848.1 AraC family transcriptional regulator [Shewanella schlegeliana]GIU36269.1 AraC family transcriptional regulator [Shewanella schlegeliana]
MASLVQIERFYGQKPQALRNVPVYSPSIIAVTTGVKTLLWQGESLTFDRNHWLLASSNRALTFVNEPHQNKFQSVQLSFLSLPSERILKQIANRESSSTSLAAAPILSVNTSLNFAFSQLIAMAEQNLSREVQQCYLDAFYLQLNEFGMLSQLFESDVLTLREQVSHYLSTEPAANHTIDSTCYHFAMSQATFMRHLSKEGSSFRLILAEVRMLYAIGIMQSISAQNGAMLSQLELAIRCGYQSEARFSQRFKAQFGISLKQYMKTIRG